MAIRVTPNLLLIGAMKAGTTSLHADLSVHPAVQFTQHKEPETLCKSTAKAEIEVQYASEFGALRRGVEIRGDASTAYAKLPTYPGIPELARRICSPGTRIIYVVRDPVQRALSHLSHLDLQGTPVTGTSADVDSYPEVVDYGRYLYQLEPWLANWPRESLFILDFQTYVSNRSGVSADLFQWLGLETEPALRVKNGAVHNPSISRPIIQGGWKKVQRSAWYRKAIRPWLSAENRRRIQQAVLPKASPGLRPTPALIDRLNDELAGPSASFLEAVGWPPTQWTVGSEYE